jgi:carboxypeptidase Q
MINTFGAYGGAVNQRTAGASKAAALGARAAIVRSPTHATDDFPHTGVVRYDEKQPKIPALTVSTIDANELSLWLQQDPSLKKFLRNSSENFPDSYSYNVIGEIQGSERPEEYITIGGHLDAWDISEGAHDDAGGCVQSMEVLRLFKVTGIKPKRTLRAVMFMNEEMSATGGNTYMEEARRKREKHYMAMESDRGVMTPRGFYFTTQGERLEKLRALHHWFKPYGIDLFERGGSGSDVGHLRKLDQPPLLIGFVPDVQRYFNFHHSANDTFDQVNEREMQMGSAAMAALVYLIDLNDL